MTGSDKQPEAARPIDCPGFPCPECGYRLVASVQVLLGSEPLVCAQCGLRLSVVPEQSAEAIEAVRRLNEALQSAGKSALP